MTFNKINYDYEIVLLLLKKEMHGREISKELNTSLTRVQSILNSLRELNIVDYKVEGKNHVYFIKKNLKSKTYILNAENYKLLVLLQKYSFLEEILKEVILKCPEVMIILFGSYAKGNSKENSDVDLYLETTNKLIKSKIELINGKISVKMGKFDKQDLLVKEIISNHVIIQGAEIFYERCKFFEET